MLDILIYMLQKLNISVYNGLIYLASYLIHNKADPFDNEKEQINLRH